MNTEISLGGSIANVKLSEDAKSPRCYSTDQESLLGGIRTRGLFLYNNILPDRCKYIETINNHQALIVIEDTPRMRALRYEVDLSGETGYIKRSNKEYPEWSEAYNRICAGNILYVSMPYIVYCILLDRNRYIDSDLGFDYRLYMFYTQKPLTSMGDMLYYTNLLNCTDTGWFCTNYKTNTTKSPKSFSISRAVEEILDGLWGGTLTDDITYCYHLYLKHGGCKELRGYVEWVIWSKKQPNFMLKDNILIPHATLSSFVKNINNDTKNAIVDVLTRGIRDSISDSPVTEGWISATSCWLEDGSRLLVYDVINYVYNNSSYRGVVKGFYKDEQRTTHVHIENAHGLALSPRILKISDISHINRLNHVDIDHITFNDTTNISIGSYVTYSDLDSFVEYVDSLKYYKVVGFRKGYHGAHNDFDEREADELIITLGLVMQTCNIDDVIGIFNKEDGITLDDCSVLHIGDVIYIINSYESTRAMISPVIKKAVVSDFIYASNKLYIKIKYISIKDENISLYSDDHEIPYIDKEKRITKSDNVVRCSITSVFRCFDSIVKTDSRFLIIEDRNRRKYIGNDGKAIYLTNVITGSLDIQLNDILYDKRRFFIQSFDVDVDIEEGEYVILCDWNEPYEFFRYRKVVNFVAEQDILYLISHADNGDRRDWIANLSTRKMNVGFFRKVVYEYENLKVGCKVRTKDVNSLRGFENGKVYEVKAIVVDIDRSFGPMLLFNNFKTIFYKDFEPTFNILDDDSIVDKIDDNREAQHGDIFISIDGQFIVYGGRGFRSLYNSNVWCEGKDLNMLKKYSLPNPIRKLYTYEYSELVPDLYNGYYINDVSHHFFNFAEY